MRPLGVVPLDDILHAPLGGLCEENDGNMPCNHSKRAPCAVDGAELGSNRWDEGADMRAGCRPEGRLGAVRVCLDPAAAIPSADTVSAAVPTEAVRTVTGRRAGRWGRVPTFWMRHAGGASCGADIPAQRRLRLRCSGVCFSRLCDRHQFSTGRIQTGPVQPPNHDRENDKCLDYQ